MSLDEQVQDIRNALWHRANKGSARVVVGAGFSRNAQPRRSNAKAFPLWSDLAREMLAALPGSKGDQTPQRLAQAYSAKFTAAGLRSFLESQIPDNDHVPGAMHQRLLQLPWTDVFTTNFDTLLERAAKAVRSRPYQCVLDQRDIPGCRPPRIVKLHGTLGCPGPLIATSDDYRQYQRTHPLFVTLMQQALAESTIVLIGFKGDDPNFEHISGWVRDCLSEYAPKIYWCGLDVSEVEDKLFRSVGVTPLDLSIIASEGTVDERHQRALDWLLAALNTKPPRDFRWAPRESSELNRGFTPFAEFPKSAWKDIPAEKLVELCAVWRAQRLEYPGWHVAPDQIRERLWNTTNVWRGAVFYRAELLEPLTRLFVLHEFFWRLDVALSPILTKEADMLVTLLESLNPFGARVDLPNAVTPPEKARENAAQAWVALAFCILRTARDDLDDARFETWLNRINQVAGERPTVRGELRHEALLRDLSRLDLGGFRTQLERWRSVASEPYELARLAGYFAERGDKPAAIQLAKRAIDGLGASTPTTLWLEAWCYAMLQALDWREKSERIKWDEAIEQAKSLGYDPWPTIEGFRDALKSVQPPQRSKYTFKARFDAGDVRRVVHLGGGGEEVPAFQFLRFIERAPSPVFAGEVTIFGEAAANAAIWIKDSAPNWSLAILLRSGANAETVDSLFDRLTVALCQREQAESLCGRLIQLARSEIGLLPSGSDEIGRRMLVTGLDVLSRFALRLHEEALLELLKHVESWLVSPAVISRFELAAPLAGLLDRVIEALPDAQIGTAVASMLPLPVYGEKGYRPSAPEQMWPEPLNSVWHRNSKPPPGWSWPDGTWEHLLSLVRSSMPDCRSRAFTRLYYLHLNSWLTTDQQGQLADAVWSCTDGPTGLPAISGFRPSVVLHLPQAELRGATGLLKKAFLNRMPKSWETAPGEVNFDQLVHNKDWFEGLASMFKHEGLAGPHELLLPLEQEEAANLAALVLNWWKVAKPATNPRAWASDNFDVGNVEAIIESLCALVGETLLFRLPPENPLVGELMRLFDAAAVQGYPTLRLLPGQVHRQMKSVDVAAGLLAEALQSDATAKVNPATEVLLTWHRGAMRTLLPPMPPILLVIAAVRIGLRCDPGIVRLIRCMAAIVEDEGLHCPQPLVDLLLLALVEIARATEPRELKRRLESSEVDQKFVMDHLHIRSWSALLARKLEATLVAGAKPLPEILRIWHEIREQAVLPEIRRA